MDTNLNPEQGLKLIESMIAQAKHSFQRISFYFMLWGGLLLVATLMEYFMGQAGMPNGWLGWPIMGTLGGIVAWMHGSREGQKSGVATFADRVFMWVWMAFIITLLLIIVSNVAVGSQPGPWVCLLTGMPTFITGGILRFRPLVVGGVLFWLFGMVSLFVWPEQGALLFGLALVTGYIIPGILLKRQEDGVRTA
ncbi:MAG: hypothetical protein IT225_00060 [Flavobacteriales bacterium]|nr:hypothetical protein [Flavobacteriales bacterium]